MEHDIDVLGPAYIISVECNVQRPCRLLCRIEVDTAVKHCRIPKRTNTNDLRSCFVQKFEHFRVCFRRHLHSKARQVASRMSDAGGEAGSYGIENAKRDDWYLRCRLFGSND